MQSAILQRSAAEICACCELSDAAIQLAGSRTTAAEFLPALVAGKLYRDAFRYVAHSLTNRQAVWWGCMCLWEAAGGQFEPKALAALQAAAQWALEPVEGKRRAAEAAGREIEMGQPARAVALAAFYSGGSMSRPGLPEVPPPPKLTATAVAGAALLAAGQKAGDADRLSRQFLAFANDVVTLPYLQQPK